MIEMNTTTDMRAVVDATIANLVEVMRRGRITETELDRLYAALDVLTRLKLDELS
jgi:hypothetical protein